MLDPACCVWQLLLPFWCSLGGSSGRKPSSLGGLDLPGISGSGNPRGRQSVSLWSSGGTCAGQSPSCGVKLPQIAAITEHGLHYPPLHLYILVCGGYAEGGLFQGWVPNKTTQLTLLYSGISCLFTATKNFGILLVPIADYIAAIMCVV